MVDLNDDDVILKRFELFLNGHYEVFAML